MRSLGRKLASLFTCIAIGALSLSACSTEDPPAPESQPVSAEEELPGDLEYKTVVELRDAVVYLGFPCPEWDERNQVTLAAGSGVCSTSSVLSVYLSDASKDEAIQNLKSFNDSKGTLIVGPNWIINTPDAKKWAPIFNATPVIWGAEEDTASAEKPEASISRTEMYRFLNEGLVGEGVVTDGQWDALAWTVCNYLDQENGDPLAAAERIWAQPVLLGSVSVDPELISIDTEELHGGAMSLLMLGATQLDCTQYETIVADMNDQIAQLR